MLAKSNGLTLKEHSKIVNITSQKILNYICSYDDLERFTEIVKYSSLLHDIGKLTTQFQNLLKGLTKNTKSTHRHNEVGWAFLSKYLDDDFPNKEIILNIVYWHHGISNEPTKHTDTKIVETIDEESIKSMYDYLIWCVGEDNVNDDLEFIDSVTTPFYYPTTTNSNKKDLPKLILLRSIIITGDRISSNITTTESVNDEIINSYFKTNNKLSLGKCKFDGSDRYEKQKEIVSLTTNTSLIKAPAGFGKTLVGLLWGLESDNKLLWVTPRNMVANSTYLSVIEELKNLYLDSEVSVQLVLGGEIKETNDPTKEIYKSDIIITNIDNFLAPTFKNDKMDNSSLMMGCSVIFDEYHELVSSDALMSLFVNIMRVRHRLTTSKTLLLSATQINCEALWDTLKNKTKVLPNKEEHYKPIHDKKYLIRVINGTQNDIKENTNTLVIKNLISSAQEEKKFRNYKLLLHNEFIEDKKQENFKLLVEGYNKNSLINNKKENVIGTHMLQASLDISFNNLYEEVLSPMSTLQRIGRCDRFGNCEGESIITINKVSNRGQTTIKNILFSRNLSDAWFDYISKLNNKKLNLSEIYLEYNKFIINFEKEFKSFIKNRYDESLKLLNKIYPIKYYNNKKSEIKTAGSNKLRSSSNEIFYIIKHENGKDWVGPFNKQIMDDFDKEFNEESNIKNRMVKTMIKLRNENDSRFEFNDIIDNKKYNTIDLIRRNAKKSNTPYIVYDRYYSDELGIIKNK